MSKRFYGSLSFTEIYDQAKKGHSAFRKAENGKIYFDVTIWLNDQKDKYGNDMSIQINPKKDRKEIDGNPYIGNAKLAEQQNTPVSSRDIPDEMTPISTSTGNTTGSEPIDDLPF